jgi:DNA repair exonuclease SbcCD ATPase subunit
LEQLVEQKGGLEEKLRKSTAKKTTLEVLCKTLQARNAEVNDEVRQMDAAQKEQQVELRALFTSIQTQLETQDAKSSAANADNAALRAELAQLLAAEQTRSAQQDQQLGIEDTERELVEAKLGLAAEAKDLAMAENTTLREELKGLYTAELALREQLGEYSKKVCSCPLASPASLAFLPFLPLLLSCLLALMTS